MNIIALDISKKRIGIAVSNSSLTGILWHSTIKNDMSILRKILEKYLPFHLIIGMPTHPDGKPTPNGDLIQKLVEENTFLSPKEYIDEYRSTQEAKQILEKHKLKIEIDSLVAVIMIYKYLRIESALLHYGLYY